MSHFNVETWESFQTLGKRFVLTRAVILGMVIGAVGGAAGRFAGPSPATPRWSAASLILIAAIVTGAITAFVSFLMYWIAWEVLRRRFSR